MIFYYIIGIYVIMNLVLSITWMKAQDSTLWGIDDIKKKGDLPKFTIIVPVRNEAKNILELLESLEKQTYPKLYFEVIIANDSSNDNTVEIIENFKKNNCINLVINTLNEKIGNTSPKKRAISESIILAKNEIIITTDGDCIVPTDWLLAYANLYQSKPTNFAFGLVTFKEKTKSIFEHFQVLEFASLQGVAAASLMLKSPNMCSGANMSYRKSAFEAVNGYEGNEEIASGDDEFLMHKMVKVFPNDVHFLKQKASIVSTNAHQSLKQFTSQRRRWASKWKSYENKWISVLAIYIFVCNLSVYLIPLFFNLQVALTLIILKFIAEGIFIGLIIKYLGKLKSSVYLLILQIIYPFYVTFFGLIVQKKGYIWKERQLK